MRDVLIAEIERLRAELAAREKRMREVAEEIRNTCHHGAYGVCYQCNELAAKLLEGIEKEGE